MPGWKAKSPQRSYHPGRSALAVLGFDSGFWRPMPTNLRPMPTLVPELSCHNKGFRCPTFSAPNAHTCKKPAIARGFRRRSVPTLGQNPNSAPNAHTCPRAFLSGTGVSAKFHSLVIRGILMIPLRSPQDVRLKAGPNLPRSTASPPRDRPALTAGLYWLLRLSIRRRNSSNSFFASKSSALAIGSG